MSCSHLWGQDAIVALFETALVFLVVGGRSCSCRDGWPCRVYLSFSKGHLSLSLYLSLALYFGSTLVSATDRRSQHVVNIFNGSASAAVCSRSQLNPRQTEKNLVWYKLYHELSRWCLYTVHGLVDPYLSNTLDVLLYDEVHWQRSRSSRGVRTFNLMEIALRQFYFPFFFFSCYETKKELSAYFV